MFEYDAELSSARTPEDMGFVSAAFRAGEIKSVERIISLLNSGSGCGDWAIDMIRKEIYGDQTTK
jgi:hypothetical protein